MVFPLLVKVFTEIGLGGVVAYFPWRPGPRPGAVMHSKTPPTEKNIL
jgi:hypothetical protein